LPRPLEFLNFVLYGRVTGPLFDLHRRHQPIIAYERVRWEIQCQPEHQPNKNAGRVNSSGVTLGNESGITTTS
jgi:hypothetical protein